MPEFSNEQLSELWSQQLQSGLTRLGVVLSVLQQQQLLDYLGLLDRWNRVFNLTAIRDQQQMVSRQLLDSLAILPWVPAGRVLDVGTGAGLPGIPLAVALPDRQFTLLDSNGKKTRFVQQAAAQLGLRNVSVQHRRVEDWNDAPDFAAITSRAFASLPDFVACTGHLLAEKGCWLAMKGQAERDEGGLPDGLEMTCHRLQVPGCDAERHLFELRRQC